MAVHLFLAGERNYNIQWGDDTVHRPGVATLFAGFQHIVLVCICLSGSCKKSADMICERGNVAKSVPAQSNVRPCENGSAHGWRWCGNCILDAWSSVVCPGQESRRSACQLLRKKLAEQKIDCGSGFFDAPFPDGRIARLASMPMVPLCD